MSQIDSDTVLALIAQVVPEMARRAVQVPTKRLGQVVAAGPRETEVQVIVDGDDDPITVVNATGLRLIGSERVVVDFFPPHGAFVGGVVTPNAGSKPWGSPWGMVDNVVGPDAIISWTSATTPDLVTIDTVPLLAERAYRLLFICNFRCATADAATGFDLVGRLGTDTTWTTFKTVRQSVSVESASNTTAAAAGHVDFQVPEDDDYDFGVRADAVSGGVVFSVNAGSCNFDLDDIGINYTELPSL